MPLSIAHVVGARPNFMKAAPVLDAMEGLAKQSLIHTGQHYDENMSRVFFEDLGLPLPDVNLEVGPGSQTWQTAQIMIRLDEWLTDHPQNLVVVYGDVNSTVAASMVCAKRHIRVAHVEAGLRSFDRTMPEEVNRLVTDQLADVLLTPSADADENLIREGVAAAKIHLVGNVMIDTLCRLLPLARTRWERHWQRQITDPFALVTLHRPSNVDDPVGLERIWRSLDVIARDLRLIFPMHPRTSARVDQLPTCESITVTAPLGYVDFLALQSEAAFVITDSGGVQEETTYLSVPCLTLRASTERPVTVTHGTNVVVGTDPDALLPHVAQILKGKTKKGSAPPLWDGQASTRVAAVLTG